MIKTKLSERPLPLEELRQYWNPFPENTIKLMREIKDDDRVLDIGGWWKPFNRADTVVDLKPYDTRGGGGSIETGTERFSKNSWFQMDVSSTPLPFPDKSFDFVVCSQTLEDLKDPVYLCKELMRVGKKGYIETPSIWIECQFGIDAPDESLNYPGYQQHRWFIDYEDNKVIFIPKLAYLSSFCFVDLKIVKDYVRNRRIWTSCLFWEGKFEVNEIFTSDINNVVAYLTKYFVEFNYTKYQKITLV
jgi:SAM-dependent methyltransferase